MASKTFTFFISVTITLLVAVGTPATAIAQSGGSNVYVTVYYPNWMFRSGSSSTWYAVPPWDMKFSGVTHVIQFGNVNVTTTPPYFTPMTADSLEWAYGTQSNGEATRTYYRDSLVTIAHRQGAKVLICIQQAQSGSALNSITSDSATTDAFASAVAGYVQRHNYDGVDVNWETSVGSKTQTSLLFRRLRANLGSSAVITISPLSGGWGNYDAATCNAYVNQINPQEYDISDAWNGCISANGNWPINALHQGATSGCSGTNQQGYDTRGPLQWAAQGFQRSILGIGIASFGRMYVGSKVIGGAHPISRQDVCSYYTGDQLLASGGGVLVQDTARNAEYIVGTAPSNFSYRNCTVSAGQDYFFTYQTPGVIPGQVDWVKQNGFGGLMVYDFQGDCDKAGGYGQTNPIINAIVAAVGNGPAVLDTIKPVVALTSPSNVSTVSGLVPVSATATDNVGVSRVDFLIDGSVASTDFSSPYQYSWNASSLLGSHTLAARAYDAAGNNSTSPNVTVTVVAPPPDTINPSASIAAPANGATVSGTVAVSINASDNVGVTKVDVIIDGSVVATDVSSPYTYSWNTFGLSGSHTLGATAYDLAGHSGNAAQIAVTVIPPPPPPSDSIPFPAVLRDDFSRTNGPLAGTKRWTGLLNEVSTAAMAIVDSTLQPAPDSTNAYASIVWDTLMSGGTETSIRVKQKSGNYAQSTLYLYAKMSSKDYNTGTGYRLRYWEKAGADLFEIHRIGPGYSTLTDLAATNYEINPGDVITFRVLPDNKTLCAFVNGTKIMSATDSFYMPQRWYYAYRAFAFPTPPVLDDFRVSTAQQVSAVESRDIPSGFSLEQNFPNPFNPRTVINYYLPSASRVTIRVYNVLGQEVSTLVSGIQGTGLQSAVWNAENSSGFTLPSGIYYYKLEAVAIADPAKSFTQVKKMIFLK